jgi:putative membrane protein insertion efficiency factor
MRKLAIKVIDWYKRAFSNTNPTCRYTPTCSTYSRQAFEKHNFFYAFILSVWRILRCNPLSKGGFNPVPKTRKERKEEHNHEH